MILNGRAVIAAPKQYFWKPRCHGLKNLEDEARAISTFFKKRAGNETDGSGGCEVSKKRDIKSSVVFVVLCWFGPFLLLFSFLSSEAGQPK